MPKRAIRKICILMFLFIFTFSFALPASAITEEELQKQVDTQGREAVTGNVFIWLPESFPTNGQPVIIIGYQRRPYGWKYAG
mgnify:CR=1 FL=1